MFVPLKQQNALFKRRLLSSSHLFAFEYLSQRNSVQVTRPRALYGKCVSNPIYGDSITQHNEIFENNRQRAQGMLIYIDCNNLLLILIIKQLTRKKFWEQIIIQIIHHQTIHH